MILQRGATLIEVLVSFVIVGILLGAAIPPAIDYFRDSSLRRAADEMVAGLHQAKSEAIKRNTTVVFTPNGTGWDFRVPGTGGNPDDIILSRTTPSSESAITATPTGGATVSFNSRGSTTPTNYTVDFTSSAGNCTAAGGPVRCLRIVVLGAGQVKLCDPALAAGDPRAC